MPLVKRSTRDDEQVMLLGVKLRGWGFSNGNVRLFVLIRLSLLDGCNVWKPHGKETEQNAISDGDDNIFHQCRANHAAGPRELFDSQTYLSRDLWFVWVVAFIGVHCCQRLVARVGGTSIE